MTTSEAMMARGSGVVVPDNPTLAAQRKQLNRADFVNEDPNKELQCSGGIAPLKISDLVGEMRIVSYQ